MDIAIGLPATISGATRQQMLEWARRADAAGFSSVGVIDRLVYPGYEPLAALSAAAAVTERVRLLTAVLLLPLRASAALFAKQAASVHRLSDGRLTLGVAVGGREDDFEASGLPYKQRGRRMDEMLPEIRRVWAGEERGFAGGIGPDVSADPPPLILGGMADPVFRRAAEHGAGWIAGGGLPEYFTPGRDKVRAAFEQAGRSDRPRAMSLTYFSLAPDAEAQTRSTLGDYYSFIPQYADAVVALTAKGADEVKERVKAFEAEDCDELVFFPSTADPDEVDRLAAAVL